MSLEWLASLAVAGCMCGGWSINNILCYKKRRHGITPYLPKNTYRKKIYCTLISSTSNIKVLLGPIWAPTCLSP
jgi:hypothetical protein